MTSNFRNMEKSISSVSGGTKCIVQVMPRNSVDIRLCTPQVPAT